MIKKIKNFFFLSFLIYAKKKKFIIKIKIVLIYSFIIHL